MREIRELDPSEYEAYATVAANAYPGAKITSDADRQRFLERTRRAVEDPIMSLYGLFESGELRGAMRLFDFRMKLLSTTTLVGGVGGVAVDLRHKKEKVARDMLRYFLMHYRQKDACLTALFPFRPDFYRRMGFGYGRKMNQYRVKPSSLPKGPSKANVTFLQAADKTAVIVCYQRVLERTNGLMELSDYQLYRMFSDEEVLVVGVRRGDTLRGFMTCRFQTGAAGHFLNNDLHVSNLVYEDVDALLELMTFLHTQADQIERVVIHTQADDFHFLLHDPRNDSENLIPSVYHESNVQGVGIMYRVINVRRLFSVLADHDFNGQSCMLRLTLIDTFLPENAGQYVLQVENGRCRLIPNGDVAVELQMDVAEFSSLITGAVDFKQLYRFGLAQISDPDYVDRLDVLFRAQERPFCMTPF